MQEKSSFSTTSTAPVSAEVIACHECDLLLETVALTVVRSRAECPRCGARLYSYYGDRIEKILALTLAALVLLIAANCFPIVGLNIQGHYAETTLFDAVRLLWRDEREGMSALVLTTTVLMPALELSAVLWLVLPLWRGLRSPGFALVFRVFRLAQPWAMVEVFILGVLVSLIKLTHMADVLPGPAMGFFGGLMLLLTALGALLDPHALWHAWENALPAQTASVAGGNSEATVATKAVFEAGEQ